MIFMKESPYIKEEPSSPAGIENWKSDDHGSEGKCIYVFNI